MILVKKSLAKISCQIAVLIPPISCENKPLLVHISIICRSDTGQAPT